MKKPPKKIKTFLALLIDIADTVPSDMGLWENQSEDDLQTIGTILAGLQNDLGEANEMLEKYGLRWNG